MARISSALGGLIPKSTGGRMALGVGTGLGVAAGVVGARKMRTNRANRSLMEASSNRRQAIAGGAPRAMGTYPGKGIELNMDGGMSRSEAVDWDRKYGGIFE